MSKHHVSARISGDLHEAIEEIQEAERVDRSTAIARLLERGVAEWRLDTAIEGYRRGELSLGRAAERADVSLWRLLDELDERGVQANYTEEDLHADVAALDDG